MPKDKNFLNKTKRYNLERKILKEIELNKIRNFGS